MTNNNTNTNSARIEVATKGETKGNLGRNIVFGTFTDNGRKSVYHRFNMAVHEEGSDNTAWVTVVSFAGNAKKIHELGLGTGDFVLVKSFKTVVENGRVTMYAYDVQPLKRREARIEMPACNREAVAMSEADIDETIPF